MIYLELFLAFVQIGTIAFGGGYAALPIIQDVIVRQKGWLTMTEMTDVVTISQLTPGPIAINAASFVGTKIGGIPGAIVATLGNILPQTILMLILGYFLFRGRKIKALDKMLKALRPGVVGLIGTATLTMMISSFVPQGLNYLMNHFNIKSIDLIALFCFTIGLVLYIKKVDMIKLIGLGAAMGLVLAFVEKYILLIA